MEMRNTYRNDNETSAYPFISGTRLPFSSGVITYISVCVLMPDEQYDIQESHVSGISITKDTVTVHIQVKPKNEHSWLGITCSGTRDGESVVSSTDRLAAFVVPGIISDSDIGSYDGYWVLDPSCISTEHPGYYSTIYVNGKPHGLFDTFAIQFTGTIDVDISELASGNSGQSSVYVTGVPADDMVLSVQNTVSEYEKVLTVNGVTMPLSPDTLSTLAITAEVRSSDGDVLDPSSYIAMSVQTEYVSADYMWGPSVILSIQGKSGLPVCMSQAGPDADEIES